MATKLNKSLKTSKPKPAKARKAATDLPPMAHLALSASRDIPLNCLELAQENVRQIAAGVSIEDLAEDIARRTLLQSLTVRPILNDAGQETGRYSVPAGGRRFRALELLAAQGRLAPDAPIPCVIRTEGDAVADSLAENIQRAPLHPLDQFRAFQTLRDRGQSETDIAAAFAVTPHVVRQRLRLANLAPALLERYAADELDLDQLMAFTVTTDHARQLNAFEALQRAYVQTPNTIRRLLTEGAVSLRERRAVFVGSEAYENAGGTILRDLFSAEGDGWCADAALLTRLAQGKLDAEAERLRSAGWAWIESAIDLPHGATFDLQRLPSPKLPAAELERYDALKADYATLEARHADDEELPAEIDAQLGDLEAAIEAFEQREPEFDAGDKARAGGFVTLGPRGELARLLGFVKPAPAEMGAEDRAAHADQDDASTVSPPAPTHAEPDEDAGAALSEKLRADLSTFRTVGLQDALGRDANLAYRAVLHALALSVFYPYRSESCVRIKADLTPIGREVQGLAEFAPAAALRVRHENWQFRLPTQSADLWEILESLSPAEQAELLAHCAALCVDALLCPTRRDSLLAHADVLSGALAFDVAAVWRPTAANYFSRVTRSQILSDVAEACGEGSAATLAGLKKAPLALEAERRVAGTTWLPALLRSRNTPEPAVSALAVAAE